MWKFAHLSSLCRKFINFSRCQVAKGLFFYSGMNKTAVSPPLILRDGLEVNFVFFLRQKLPQTSILSFVTPLHH